MDSSDRAPRILGRRISASGYHVIGQWSDPEGVIDRAPQYQRNHDQISSIQGLNREAKRPRGPLSGNLGHKARICQHCPRRVYAGACEAFEIILAHRLRFSRY